MTIGKQVFDVLLGPCRTYKPHGFLEIKHLMQMNGGMVRHAVSLDCNGLWDEVNISSGDPDL